MAAEWTPEQFAAIRTTGRNLLVSAAAGSGKTAVLAERCAYLVADAPVPCDADELLVVTFTVAAAEEMRRRIGKNLSARVIRQPTQRLLRQPTLLAGAQIGTIHGLCSAILRRHFHEAGLDPNFRLLDEDEARLLRRDVAGRLVERKLEGKDADVTVRLLETYAGGSPARIVDTLLGFHNRLTSLCDPAEWMAERRQRLSEAARLPLGESELGQEAIRILTDRLRTMIANAERIDRALHGAGIAPYSQSVRAMADALRDWSAALTQRPFDQTADIIRSTEFENLPRLKDAEARERFKPRIDALKRGINNFAKSGLFLFTEQQLRIDTQRTLWAVDALSELAESFADDYATAKRDTGVLDFSDLERFALDLLRDPDTGKPTEIAEQYRTHFKHVLVDEYQDVNELQDTLLKMLSREEAGNLFCVGDVKQSIYRFRQADPARFIARYRRYTAEAPRDGDVIDMQKNFRSRGPLLETLNGVFEALMTYESAEVRYDESQKLVPGATFVDAPGTPTGRPIELHVIARMPTAGQSDLDADEREAVLVALRIRTLLGRDGGSPVLVTDRNGIQRPADPGDFAVLLRTVRVKSERYASVLRRAGLPVLADSSTGFFDAPEVRDLLCALRLIDNERQEYDFVGHLRSPLCEWPGAEDRLAAIRVAYPPQTVPWFHRAAARYASEKNDDVAVALREVYARLDRWRTFAAERPVADVVWKVLEETHYHVFVAGLPDGEQRMANLLEIHERARAFDRFRRPTLSRFLHYLAELEDETDLGMPSVAGAERRAVRLMSVHKSKGLEYPVVVLPDLGKEFNLREAGDMLLFDDAVGLGLRVVDLEREAHYPSLASTVAQYEIRRKALAEEQRVLYVGATRAREHLILVGTADAGVESEWDESWRGHRGPMPPGDVLSARTMLDWVGAAAAQVESACPNSFDRTMHTADDIDRLAVELLTANRREDNPSLLADLPTLSPPPPDTKVVEAAVRRLQFRYDRGGLATTPAVRTVTDERSRHATGGESQSRSAVVSFEPVLRPARCASRTPQLSPADRGAITHLVLQRLDFEGDTSPQGVRTQVRRMVERRFLRGDVADEADVDTVAWFASTDLGRQCREAGDALQREFELVFAANVGDANRADESQMVRGRIDALIVEDDGLTLIDYKTDRVTSDTLSGRVAFHHGQIDTYRRELGRVTGRTVKAAYLVFTAVRRIVAV